DMTVNPTYFAPQEVVQWNCTNLLHSKRMTELQNYLHSNKAGIVALQEHRCPKLHLTGFRVESSDDLLTATLISNHVIYKRMRDLERKIPMSNVVIKVWSENSEIILVNAYRNPSLRACRSLDGLFSEVKELQNVIVMGDLNAVGRTCNSSSGDITQEGKFLDEQI